MRIKFITTDGNSVYLVKPTGELLIGLNGEVNLSNYKQIGQGWQKFSKVFSGGGGILYAIQPTGELFWYKDKFGNGANAPNGGTGWEVNSGNQIGFDWQKFSQVIGGEDGVIYAIKPNGELLWYRDEFRNGTNAPSGHTGWAANSGKQIGTGWNVFTQVVYGGDGMLYGVTHDGNLHWYRDIFGNGSNAANGSSGWAANSGSQISQGWQYFTHVFGAPASIIYASRVVEECGQLWRYQDTLRNGTNGADGGSGWDVSNGFVADGWEISPVEGYCWPVSAAPGEIVSFFVSSPDALPLHVSWVRLREQANGTYGEPAPGGAAFNVPGRYQASDDLAWQNGCDWTSSFQVTVPSSWPSGFYAARCTSITGFVYQIPFVVKPSPQSRGDFLVVINTNTWVAYNRWSGNSNYTFLSKKILSYLRPNNHLLTGPTDHAFGNHLLRGEIWMVDWLQSRYNVDLYTDIDWAMGIPAADSYAGFILQTHPEYWSPAMRDSLRHLLSNGMNLIHLGGNALFRAVSHPADTPGNVLPVSGPQFSTSSDGTEQTMNDNGAVRSLLGTQFNWGGHKVSSPYAINPAHGNHWVFQGIQNIDPIAGKNIGLTGRNGRPACSWEVDTAILQPPGPPQPAGRDFSPPGTLLLAAGLPETEDATPSHGVDATGHMIYFEPHAGKFAFAAPSIPFGASLVRDADLQIVVTNVLNACLQSIPIGVLSITLNPTTVTAGESSMATITLNRPAHPGGTVVALLSDAPGFATVPEQVAVSANQVSATFAVSTPPIAVAFETAHADIDATLAGTFARAVLTIKPSVLLGFVADVSLSPGTIASETTSLGTVTLTKAVPVATVVALSVLQTGGGPIGHLPSSNLATVPAAITIPAGSTVGHFTLKAGAGEPGVKYIARVSATATNVKYTTITIIGAKH